jgi:hypothetical protein
MRQVLRLPVGPQFKKILEDDHEWLVITDMRLKPIIVKRGEEDCIYRSTVFKAYDELEQKIRGGRNAVRVLVLHSHPHTQSNSPTGGDLDSFFKQKTGFAVKSIIISGFGIITRKGIFIIKLPENLEKLGELGNTVPDKYTDKKRDYMRASLKKDTYFEAYEHAQSMEESDRDKIEIKSQENAFKGIKKETPQLKTRMVRKTHRFNMGVRR